MAGRSEWYFLALGLPVRKVNIFTTWWALSHFSSKFPGWVCSISFRIFQLPRQYFCSCLTACRARNNCCLSALVRGFGLWVLGIFLFSVLSVRSDLVHPIKRLRKLVVKRR